MKSSLCQTCSTWKRKKDEAVEKYDSWYETDNTCTINHTGSADKMEIDAVKEMYIKSEELYGVKYTAYISDGASETYKGIMDINSYGEKITVQ